MSEPVLVPPAGGEVIGDTPWRRVEILADHEALVVTWSRFGPRRNGADLHVHRLHTDLFYVLGGVLTLRLGIADEHVTVPAGTLVRVPPLVVHGFRNASDADVTFLNLHAPGADFAHYLRALRDGRSFSYDQYDPPQDGGRPVSEAVIGSAERAVDHPGPEVTLLADIEEIGIVETTCAEGERSPVSVPGFSGAPRSQSPQLSSYYVLEGELTVTIADRELLAAAGAWVEVPHGTPHDLAPSGVGETRFLSIHTPADGLGADLRTVHGD